MARMETLTVLRKTPASSPAGCGPVSAQVLHIRVNPRNLWLEPPLSGSSMRLGRSSDLSLTARPVSAICPETRKHLSRSVWLVNGWPVGLPLERQRPRSCRIRPDTGGTADLGQRQADLHEGVLTATGSRPHTPTHPPARSPQEPQLCPASD
jgi:hypothetical protein